MAFALTMDGKTLTLGKILHSGDINSRNYALKEIIGYGYGVRN
jgi:hypothetical protein